MWAHPKEASVSNGEALQLGCLTTPLSFLFCKSQECRVTLTPWQTALLTQLIPQ